MASITTYHATLDAPDAFKDGFRPLSHFGAPRVGLWQVIRKFAWIRSDFPVGAYVYEVEIDVENAIELPDYDSANSEALLWAYQKYKDLPFEQYYEWRRALPYPSGNHHNNAAAAFLLRLDGWDAIRYRNVHEARGLESLTHIDIGPEEQNDICWSNLSIRQVAIKKEPVIVPILSLKEAIQEIMRPSPSWADHPFARHLEEI